MVGAKEERSKNSSMGATVMWKEMRFYRIFTKKPGAPKIFVVDMHYGPMPKQPNAKKDRRNFRMRSKRVLSALLSLALVVSLVAGCVTAGAAETANFSDVSGHWAEEALTRAVENGLLQGTNDGLLRPNDKLSRAQLAAIVVRAFAAKDEADLSTFADVDANAWYYKELSKAVAMGVLQGDGAGMRPNDNITRQEAFAVVSRLLLLKEGKSESLKSFDDNAQVAQWAEGSVAALVEKELVQGNGNKLAPTAEITRAEFATIFDRAVNGYVRGGDAGLTEAKNLAVTGAATLKGVKISGDLYIGDGVGTGEIVLDGVTVEGRLIIRGGAKVTLKNGASIKGETVRKDGLTTPVVTESAGGSSGGGSSSNRKYEIKQSYTYDEVKAGFADTGLQGSVKQYVNFLTDPSYGTGNDSAFDALDLANTETFVNKDFALKPSLFPSLRNVVSSALSENRSTLWLAYAGGGVDCVNVNTGELIAQFSAEELAIDNILLLVADGTTNNVYVISDVAGDAVTLIAR